MYYDITKQDYTRNKPSGSRGTEWVEVYAKTGKPLALEDLKEFPNIYKSLKDNSSKFWERIYELASRVMVNYTGVFSNNFEEDIVFPIFGMYIKTYSDFLEFLELFPNPRWTKDSYSENFIPKYMGFDRTLVWDYFSDSSSAKNYFFNNIYTLEEYKNQFLNQKQSTDEEFKISRPVAKITRGAEIRGHTVQGRKCQVTVTIRPLSNQEVIVS
jgi:hypothetical protein